METESGVMRSQANDSQEPQKLKEVSWDFLPNTAEEESSATTLILNF